MDCCGGKRCNPVTKGIDDTRGFGSKRAPQHPMLARLFPVFLALLFPRLNVSHPNDMFGVIDLKRINLAPVR